MIPFMLEVYFLYVLFCGGQVCECEKKPDAVNAHLPRTGKVRVGGEGLGLVPGASTIMFLLFGFFTRRMCLCVTCVITI